MILLDTNYVEVKFDKEKELGVITWKSKCTSEEYRGAFAVLLDLQKTEKITRYILDIRKQAVISPDDRKWFETVAFPQAVAQGLKVSSAVFDGNVFKKYYINVILSATNKFGVPMKIYNELEDAMSYVLSK